jgi:hypothetical protein
MVTSALYIMCQTSTGLLSGEERGLPVIRKVSNHANEDGSPDKIAADGGRLTVPQATDGRRRTIHQTNTQKYHCVFFSTTATPGCDKYRLLTIGDTVLISTQDEDNHGKPESKHLATGTA